MRRAWCALHVAGCERLCMRMVGDIASVNRCNCTQHTAVHAKGTMLVMRMGFHSWAHLQLSRDQAPRCRLLRNATHQLTLMCNACSPALALPN